jgi:hypothetical protein
MRTNHSTRATCIALAFVFASVFLVDCDEDGSLQATAPSAVAPTMKSSAAARIVLGTSTCGVIDSNANCVASPFTAIVTSSTPGVEIERYSADGVFNDTGHAVVFTFADFGPPFGYCVSEVTGALSADWVESLSASGHASIVCRFRS